MKIIAGLLKNRKIVTPKGSKTRPTSGQLREALFNVCQMYIEGARFLDLFAGSGAVGLEALSRGAADTTFIDIDRHNIRCIQQNLEIFQLESQAAVICASALPWLEKAAKKGEQYDIIFADPPYAQGEFVKGQLVHYGESVLKIIDEYPLLSSGGVLFIEEASEIQIEKVQVNTLKLKSSRRFGRSRLHQYEIL